VNDLLRELIPAIRDFVLAVVPILLTWIAAKLAAKQTEKINREALHSALETGTRAATERLTTTAGRAEIAAQAVHYAQESVPQAIKSLNPSKEVLTKLALAKQQETKS
jgi:hypothetical protein